MKRQIITDVVQQMLPHLDNAQLKQLQKVLECTLFGCDITKQEEKETTNDNPKLIDSFISANAYRRMFGENFEILSHHD